MALSTENSGNFWEKQENATTCMPVRNMKHEKVMSMKGRPVLVKCRLQKAQSKYNVSERHESVESSLTQVAPAYVMHTDLH